jgi:hypothetical protein
MQPKQTVKRVRTCSVEEASGGVANESYHSECKAQRIDKSRYDTHSKTTRKDVCIR